MKDKLTLFTPIIVVILTAVILILSYNLHNLYRTVETMKSDGGIENHIEEKITSIENRVNNLEIEMPNQNLDQFITSTNLELNRIEDLLNKFDGLKTVFGIVTGLDNSNKIILDVKLVDSQENIQIELSENCRVYVVGQFTNVPIDTEEFVKMLEEDLKKDFEQGFTFKIINEKAIQIYQGWGDLN